jgi:hypothetical protein
MPVGKKALFALFAALVLSVTMFTTAFAASEFEGTWTIEGMKGKHFDVVLSADGKATTTHAKAMTGTWSEDAGTATIKWDTGWTTKISKDGDHYSKQTITNDGKELGTTPAVKK